MNNMIEESNVLNVEKPGKLGSTEYWKLVLTDDSLIFYSPKLKIANVAKNVASNFLLFQGALGGIAAAGLDKISEQSLTIDKIKQTAKQFIELPLVQYKNLPVKSKLFSKSISFENNGVTHTFRFSKGQFKSLVELINKKQI